MADKKKAKVTIAKPKSLNLKRGNNVQMVATWSLSSAQKKDYNRLKYAYSVVSANADGKLSTVNNPYWSGTITSVNTSSRTINLNDLLNTYTRQSWYPFTEYRLKRITMQLYLAHSTKKYESNSAFDTYEFAKPDKPKVAIAYTETGRVNITLTPAADSGKKERAGTWVKITRQTHLYDSTAGKIVTKAAETKYNGRYTGDSAHTYSYDETQRAVTDGEWIQWRVEAWSQGFAGDSAHVSASKIISQPARATFYDKRGGEAYPKLVKRDPRAIGWDVNDSVVFALSTNTSSYFPVSGLRLQLAVGVTAAKAEDIDPSDWDDTSYTDEAQCSTIQCDVATVLPARGLHTWARIKSWHDYESIHYVYSKPIEVTCLYQEPQTGVDDPAEIISAVTGDDGESAVVVVGWNKTQVDDATSTELSWSDQPDTWQSTEEPEIYDFTWSDTTPPTGYGAGATVIVKGLKTGTRYYFRARRHTVTDVVDTYSAYSSIESTIPIVVPDSVELIAPSYLPRGNGAQFAWTYNSEAPQTAWRIVEGNTVNGRVIAEGTDAAGSCVVAFSKLEESINDNVVICHIEIDVGNGFVYPTIEVNGVTTIATASITIIDAPTLAITAATPFVAQPLSFTLTSNTPADRATVKVLSSGIVAQGAGGDITQAANECVWSDVITPTWTESDDVYTATVTLPTIAQFIDGCDYTIVCTLTDIMPDGVTGIDSDTVTAVITCDWTRKAPAPPESITITPTTTTDTDGNVTRACVIALAAPTGVTSTDVYDVYRMTADRSYLVARDVPTDATVTDEFAPYGDGYTAYRIVTRTVDGATDWLDYPYDYDVRTLRIDFGKSYIELPYNIEIDNSYEPDYETRKHLDGTTGGYFNDGYTRKAGLNTDVVRIDTDEQRTLIKALGAYTGAVFVRTPQSEAFQAVLTVSDDSSASSAITSASFSATEIKLTEQYMIPPLAED